MARSRVTGARETAANLRALGRFVSTPVGEASRYALGPFPEAKDNAPVKSGVLRKSLTIRKVKSPKDQPEYRVGPRRGSPAVHYAHLTEFGRPPDADGRGGMPGTRWLTRAFEATREAVVTRFGERIGPAIEKHAAKLAAKVRR